VIAPNVVALPSPPKFHCPSFTFAFVAVFDEPAPETPPAPIATTVLAELAMFIGEFDSRTSPAPPPPPRLPKPPPPPPPTITASNSVAPVLFVQLQFPTALKEIIV
jgi:hypothetical protein